MNARRHIPLALRTTATISLLGWLLLKVDWSAIGNQFVELKTCWFLLALAMPAGALYLMSLRWTRIAAILDIPMRLPEVLRLTFVGQFFNAFLPGATGGDIYKISSVCGLHPGRKAIAASSVLIDRLFATIALLLVGLFSLIGFKSLWLSILENSAVSPSMAALLLAGGCLTAALLFALLYKTGKLPSDLLAKTGTYFASLKASRLYAWNLAAPLLLLSLAIHLINFSGAFFLSQALAIDVSYGQMLALMPVLLIAILLPLSINGHGIREVVIIGYFTMLNIHSASGPSPREISIAFSLLYVTIDTFWCLPGAAIFLLKRNRNANSEQNPST